MPEQKYIYKKCALRRKRARAGFGPQTTEFQLPHFSPSLHKPVLMLHTGATYILKAIHVWVLPTTTDCGKAQRAPSYKELRFNNLAKGMISPWQSGQGA